MVRRLRARRVLKWTGTIICVLILPVWWLSSEGVWMYHFDTWCVATTDGSLWLEFGPPDPALGRGWRGFWVEGTLWLGQFWPVVFKDLRGNVDVVVPWCFLLALMAIPTALLWWLDRRRIPPGHCQKCSYDLTGNVSGICPECGTPISNAGAQSRSRNA
jgi:hypothetical protein